jgi:hypothetical protein
MSPALHKDPVEETLLLFGPQIARIVPARLSELRNTIISNPKLAFLKDIIHTYGRAQFLPVVRSLNVSRSLASRSKSSCDSLTLGPRTPCQLLHHTSCSLSP